MGVQSITPEPTEDEAAAIVAALDAVAAIRPAEEPDGAAVRWRWSGRWWSKPIPLRRDRPW